MTRRRKKKDFEVLAISSGVAILLITMYAIENPSSFFSIAFVLALIAVLATATTIFGKRLFAEAKDSQMRDRLVRKTRDTYADNQVDFLNPTEFEHYVAGILEKIGYKTLITQSTNDGGIDVVLKRNEITTGVQVKKWQNNVGRPDLQKLVGAGSMYDRIMCVTTSNFSTGAREYAAKHNIVLVDGNELTILAEKAFGKNHTYTTLSAKIMGKYCG